VAILEFKCPTCKRELLIDPLVRSDAWCARCDRFIPPPDISAEAQAQAEAKRLFQLLNSLHFDLARIESTFASLERGLARVRKKHSKEGAEDTAAV